MPENKNDYSHLKVPQSNFYSPSLYGQDVEVFHQGNSRELMLRYVKTMKISRYVLIAVFIAIYAIGGLDLGSYFPSEFLNYAISHLKFMMVIYDKVASFGGDDVIFFNLSLILLFIIPSCIVFGLYISILEMMFLIRFDFSKFIAELSPSNFKVLAAFLGSILFLFSFNLAYTTVGDPDASGRLSFIWKPVDGMIGYTIYGMCAYCALRGIPGFITSIYILILKAKGDIK